MGERGQWELVSVPFPNFLTCSEKSEKQLKREAKKLEKKSRKEMHKSQEGAAGAADPTANGHQDENDVEGADVSEGCYGKCAMNQSRERLSRALVDVAALGTKLDGQDMWVRARVHTSRAKGKQCFFVLRQQQATVQCLAFLSEAVSKQMIKFISQ